MPAPLYLCLHLPDFAVQALVREQPALRGRAVAVLAGEPPLERVFAMNAAAAQLGVQLGMSRIQAESFGDDLTQVSSSPSCGFAITVLRRNRELEQLAFDALCEVAQRFSPRVETLASPDEQGAAATLVLDVAGSERLLGAPRKMAATIGCALAEIGFEARVASSQNASTAVLAARGRTGLTVIGPGTEAESLAALPIAVLQPDAEQQQSLASWGIQTLGELAALPKAALAARLGQSGARMQAQARGSYAHLLAPDEEPADAALEESIELEHPVELLEPLLFLINQMLERILQRAAERALAIAWVESRLVLATAERAAEGANQGANQHRRVVRPALPESERATLLKLIQLDLEMHPPGAAVTALHLTAHPARAQQAQQGLFAAQAPEAGKLEVLMARLRKLVGEERVGSAELLDTNAPESFRMDAFTAEEARRDSYIDLHKNTVLPHAPAMRMVRPPRAVSVEVERETPVAMHYEGARLRLRCGSGPWRTSGAWWTQASWSREEWDVTLNEQRPAPAPAAGAASAAYPPAPAAGAASAAYPPAPAAGAASAAYPPAPAAGAASAYPPAPVPSRCLRLARDPGADCWYVIGIYD